jgi:hypothetical protein
MLPRWGWFGWDVIAGCGRGAPRLDQAIEPVDDPAQTIEVEQVLGRHGGRILRRWSIIGATQSDGGVAPVGEHDNQVRIVASAKANNLDPLPPERMMGMGDGDKSQRWWG